LQIDPQLLLLSLVDASIDGIFAFDREYRLISWNQAMERLTGVSRADALGRIAQTVFPILVASGEENQLRAALEGKNAIRENTSFSSHQSLSFSHYYSPLRDQENQVIGGIGIVREVIAAGHAQDHSDEASQRFAYRVENSPLAVIEWSPDFRVSHWSESAERLFGWKAEEVIGKRATDWQFVFAEDIEAVKQVTQRQREGAEGHGVLRNRNYTKDGTVLFCEWYNSVTHDEQGRLVSVLSLVLDVTARKQAEEERAALLLREREARRHAEEADRLKDEFLATLSHELRTPLTSILGWASMIRNGELDPSNVGRAIETIERNARSQARLIDDLLDVSRIITGNLRLELNPLDFAPIVEAGLDALRPTAQAKGIRLRKEFEPDHYLVKGDTNRLRQVIWNLVSNAIKFTPRGGVVTVSLTHVQSYVRLSVNDTGEGILPEFLPYVFDRFRQAEASISRRQGGLGLGLAVVRHLVELHGGNISAESGGLNQGSTFTVDLPLAIERRDPARADERKREMERRRQSRPNAVKLDGLFILVIEDDDDSRSLVGTMLEGHGAEVLYTSSAPEALNLLQKLSSAAQNGESIDHLPNRLPDLLISDIGMPDEDGYELLLKIRTLSPDKGGQIPAIALTGYATRQDREHALAAGYQLHLAKPIEPTDLLAAIIGLFQRGESQQETATAQINNSQ
jgi:PAS domain S-box-containing protein